MRSTLGKIKRALFNRIYHYVYMNSIKAYWYPYDHNFGDILNPLFINKLSGKKIIWINPKFYRYKNYLVIGSILDRVNKYSTVWGAGFISEDGECPEKPAKVCAVRGPLSRDKLLNSGIECPQIFGDPALLLPLIYEPKTEKKYKLGIIPHYKDKDNLWLQNVCDSKVLIIDIQTENPFDFVEELNSCEKIASSSLHGIIVADAYGIPSLWLEFSNNVTGKGFKFLDYFLSVNRSDRKPLVINKETSVNNLLDSFIEYEIDIDLSKLLDACPFKLEKYLE